VYFLQLQIPETPKSLNKKLRAHRFANLKEMKSWAQVIHLETRYQKPKCPLERARIKIIRNAHRMLDFDGLVGSMKPVVDALVKCGILKDDSYNVTGPWDVTQKYRPQKSGQLLEVFVTEVVE
jgi:Holliday junction resolvase RusA-like endonuclease